MIHPLLRQTAAAVPLLLGWAIAHAQTPATPPPSEPAPASRFDEWIKPFKKPTPWLTLTGDFRARNEYYGKIVTLGAPVTTVGAPPAEQDLLRFRTRIAASAALDKDFSFNARLASEPRNWIKPSFVGAYRSRQGMEWRYGIVDSLNLKWTTGSSTPITFTVGRQDIMLGDPLDWWLVMDGSPGEGSWTTFFDAARMTIDAKSLQTKFEVIALCQEAQPGGVLPTIGHSSQYPLTDQDERGAIFYVSNKSVKNTQIDGYLIYKHDDRRTFTVAGTQRTPGDNADIATVGAKITGTPAPHWQYSVEGAYQTGSKYDRISGAFARRDLEAYGAKGRLTFLAKDPLNQQFSLTGEWLSGDDPATAGTDEMFDLLWGRWPRWSELYIYSYINETGGRIAQMNNLARLGATWSLVPAKGTTLSFTYNALYAPELTPTRTVAPTLFSTRNHFRGHSLQAVLKHQFNKRVSGHLWGEWIKQGRYYTNREVLTFLRAELMFSF